MNKQRLFPVEAVARQLGVSHMTIRRLIAAGAVRAVRIRSRVMVNADDVDRLVRDGFPTGKRGCYAPVYETRGAQAAL